MFGSVRLEAQAQNGDGTTIVDNPDENPSNCRRRSREGGRGSDRFFAARIYQGGVDRLETHVVSYIAVSSQAERGESKLDL